MLFLDTYLITKGHNKMNKKPIARMLSTIFLCSTAICGSVNAATLIHAGKIITAEDNKILTDHTIVIEQDKIIAVEAG
ncbi:MAG TPA: hypothetical protein VIN66_10345, partial [Rheinheimera sp.]